MRIELTSYNHRSWGVSESETSTTFRQGEHAMNSIAISIVDYTTTDVIPQPVFA
ncbi:hypothetical protein Mal48_44560 [Thalassoglobus polymorphus]|uniref:Uncharacterized protein n=1 Tax=Thalassoglobus polymorphus TaxID=2527994 RepID=A0A517QU63_9PLAN|nr:hypothetical protein Mal48_44560 [Thalassoglobus polymorphus]